MSFNLLLIMFPVLIRLCHQNVSCSICHVHGGAPSNYRETSLRQYLLNRGVSEPGKCTRTVCLPVFLNSAPLPGLDVKLHKYYTRF